MAPQGQDFLIDIGNCMFESGVLQNSMLYGKTVPSKSLLFGGTVPPNSVSFCGTVLPNSLPRYSYSSLSDWSNN